VADTESCSKDPREPPSDFDIYEVIKEIGGMERHFHQIQHQYRVLASTWILAVFAAAGFILATEELDSLFSFNRVLAVVVLTGFGALGITLLYIMDVLVYGKLLKANFVKGKELEQKYHWLPSVRQTMKSPGYLPRGDVKYTRLFYVGANAVVLGLGGASLTLLAYGEGAIAYLRGAIVFWVVVVAWCLYLYRKTPLDPAQYVDAGPISIKGRAWSGFGDVKRVEFSSDGGRTWNDATLDTRDERHGWFAWSYKWDAQEPGKHELCARATDETGNTQPLDSREVWVGTYGSIDRVNTEQGHG
jgi:hypothetical protein